MKLRDRVVSGVVIVVLFAAGAAALWGYWRTSERWQRQGIDIALGDLMREQQVAFKGELDGKLRLLNALATGAAQGGAVSAERAAAMRAGAGEAVFDKVGLIGPNGMGYLDDGQVLDVRASDYYRAALEGESRVFHGVWPPENGEARFVATRPIMEGDRLAALAVGRLNNAQLSELLADQSPDQSSYCFVTDEGGTILVAARHMGMLSIAGNVLTFYREAVLEDGASVEALEQAMQAGRSGTLAYRYGNQRRYTSYTPLGVGDCYLFCVTPRARMDAPIVEARSALWRLGLKLTAIAALLLVFGWWRRRRLKVSLGDARRDAQRQGAMRREAEALSYTILFEVDAATGALTLNGAFERQLGRKLSIDNLYAIAEGEPQSEDAAALKKLAEAIKRGLPKSTASVQLRHQNGALIWYRVAYNALFNGDKSAPYVYMGRIANIERQDHEGDAPDMRPGSDALTGLMGHRAFMEQASLLLPGLPTGSALLVVDIDGFKGARDPKGRYDGDQLILHLGETLRRVFGSGDLVGRLGGDTFAALMMGAPSREQIAKCAQAMCDAFENLERPDGGDRPTCSVGIALVENGVDDIAELSRRADQALYRAKLAGKHRHAFYQDDQRAAAEPRGKAGDISSVLVRCTTALLTEPLPTAMDVLLGELALYYRAERAFVLTVGADALLEERFIWCARGVGPHESYRIALHEVPAIAEALKGHKPVVLTSANAREMTGGRDLQILGGEGISSIFLMPIRRDGAGIGFIGLDNPSDHMGSVSLLKTISQCLYGVLSEKEQ